jgi:hypothetical protein
LVIFLVDPGITIPSTTTIAPQQKEILFELLVLASREPGSRLGTLPLELIRDISSMVGSLMSRAEAETCREALMRERTVFVEDSNSQYFGTEFNMWCVVISHMSPLARIQLIGTQ